MFENLSKRERIMAIIVGALLPVFLGFWLVGWIGGGLQKKTEEINRLSSEATRLKAQARNARFAVGRLATYRKESLPKDGKRSALAFRNWLEELGEEYELESSRVSPANLPIKMGTGENLAMEIYKYTFNGIGTPRQVTSFLYRLNESKLLHRTALKLQPETEGRADRAKMTGRWKVTLTIEVACLPDEEREGLFVEEVRPFSRRPLQEYHDVVSRRNLHGPENEKPKFVSDNQFEFEPGERIRIPLEVEESKNGLAYADPEQFKFELLESDIDNLELTQDEDGAPTATLSLKDGLQEGTYSAKVKTTDTGWPYKDTTKTIRIVVAEPKADPVEPDPPPRKIARDTYFRGIKTTNGVPRAWIHIAPLSDRPLKLAVGESFELDGETWTVASIDRPHLVLMRGEERLVFKIGSRLDSPLPDNQVTKRDP